MSDEDILATLRTDDPTSADFWAGAARGELMIQRCSRCGTHQFYPRPFCTTCDSSKVYSAPASGRGTIYSQTTVRKPLVDGFDPPYTIGIVELAEGVRLMTTIVNGPSRIGEPVRVAWVTVRGLQIPAFEPAGREG